MSDEVVKKVQAVKIIENMGAISLLEIEFYDEVKAFMLAAYSDVSPYLEQDVIVSFRKDMKDGVISDFINTLTVLSRVVVLDKNENIKLYVLDLPDTGSNVIFKDLQLGMQRTNTIVYCDSCAIGSSPKASWVDFKVLDKKRNVEIMKVFNPENMDYSAFIGKYLLCDVRKSQYGLSTQEVRIMENLTIDANPELELAKQFLLNELREDSVLLEEVLRLRLIENMKHYSENEVKIETGYVLVQTAMEIAMAGEFRNLSKDIDYNLMRRAFIANKLYVLTHNDVQSLSKEMQNVMKLTTTKFNSKRLISLLEEKPSIVMLEHPLIRMVAETVKLILENTKSEGYRLSSDKVWGGK